MEHRLPIEQFLYRARQHPERTYLNQPQNSHWTQYSWADAEDQARRVASGLLAEDLQPGDRVAIIAKNSAEWIIADLGILLAGMISVPIYATAGAETIQHALTHSGSQFLFIGKLDNDTAITEVLQLLDTPLKTVGFPYSGVKAETNWQDWLADATPLADHHQPSADDIISIVYTSGSQGLPKGVTITNKHAMTQGHSFIHTFPDLAEDNARVMSYLPLAHITERSIVELASLYGNPEVFFTESLETFVADLTHAQPTMFLSVPRLWSKFQTGILAKINDRKLQRLLKIPLLGKLVAKRIRQQLGLGSCKIFASGSAPISPDILKWFLKLGMPIGEGWGLTESMGPACINHPFVAEDIGTIGKPMESYQMKLSEQGEILIRGDGVFDNYYRNSEITAQSFSDGWFKTGDKGEITASGAWKIIGRVKEQFKTSKGKYVAPVPIESLLGSNPLIEQVCVMGSGMKQPIALVVLADHVSADTGDTRKSLEATRQQVNAQLESHQKLDYLFVTKEPWTVENQLLTPTLKLKRDNIETRYVASLPGNHNATVILEE